MSARAVTEWIGATSDTAIPARVRLRVFDRAHGRCEICSRKIMSGNDWQADHIVALINGGENRESNLRCVCAWCHGEKTKSDVAEKSRVARIRKKRLGLTKAKRPFRGWRKFDGTIIYTGERRN